MKKRNGMPAGFSEAFDRIKQQNSDENILLQGVAHLVALTRFDGICGCWIASENSYSLLIQRYRGGFRLLLTDNTHCYKTIVRDMTATLSGERLMISDDGMGAPGGEVKLNEAGNELRCGAYGVFRSEECLLREELQHELDFALRASDDEER